jgi:D-arabinose 1-dehydrogenase-like Zn-dependent alcohol dehydrogenase
LARLDYREAELLNRPNERTLTPMHAMVLDAQRHPLQWRKLPTPSPGPEQVLIQVAACAVCRTDLHVVDGDLCVYC